MTSLKTPRPENAFANKLHAPATLIGVGSYNEARAKLKNDLVKHDDKWGTRVVGAALTVISKDSDPASGTRIDEQTRAERFFVRSLSSCLAYFCKGEPLCPPQLCP